jgi:hypothetical protein
MIAIDLAVGTHSIKAVNLSDRIGPALRLEFNLGSVVFDSFSDTISCRVAAGIDQRETVEPLPRCQFRLG